MNHMSRKDFNLLFIFFVSILCLQLFLSAKNSFISDSLAKAFQIESAKTLKSDIIYPANLLDAKKNHHPVLFIIKNKEELKSVFSQTFASIYAFIFYFIPVQLMLFFNGFFLLLSAYTLNRYANISVKVSILLFVCSIVLTQVIDLSEVPFTLFYVSLCYALWTKSIQQKNEFLTAITLLLFVLGSFLRLEILLLSSLVFLNSMIQTSLDKSFKNGFLYLISYTLAISIFLIWNYHEFGHPFGIRYLFNYSTGSNLTLISRVSNLFHILFSGNPTLGFKFGFFLFSPYFIYLCIKYWKQMYPKKENYIISFHFIVFLIYPILVGLSAPNDGITITGRYALFTIIPGIFILNHFWDKIKSDKFFLTLLLFSFFLNIFVLKISKESFKMIKKTNKIYESFKADLWIFYDQNISGTAGVHLLTQKSLSFQEFSDIEKRKQLLEVLKKNQIKSVYTFDFSKTVPNSFMNLKREIELSNVDFVKFWELEGYTCHSYQEVAFIGYRQCSLKE